MNARPRLAAVLLALLALGPARGAGAQDAEPAAAGSAELRVDVLTEDGASPLAFGVVSVPAQGLERFTNVLGGVVLAVRPGRVLVRVKRLGFVPRDTTVDVAAGESRSVRVALARVSFRLDPVRVVSWPTCRRPGIPRRGGDPQLRGVVEQLRQNAERYRLLTRSYPFSYETEREFSEGTPGTPMVVERTDTVTVSGAIIWRYAPGRMIAFDRGGGRGQWRMHLPTISDLADDRFIENHCFHVAGLEAKGDAQLLRIDIVAADRLRSPDVNVTVWLDPSGFQLRHASFTLVKTASFPHLLHVVSEVDYVEVVPFIPVMHRTVTENLVEGEREPRSFVERQTIVRLTFLGARP